jgi:hypothetical protein
MALTFNAKPFCNALKLGDRARDVDRPNKVVAIGVMEILAPESQITGKAAVLGRDSRKRSVDCRAMRRMVE